MRLNLTWGQLAQIVKGTLTCGDPQMPFEAFCTDTRSLGRGQVFWALKGARYDAHEFLDVSLSRGSMGWVIRKGARNPGQNHPSHVLEVEETLSALQDLSAHHRKRFSIPVVAITGSNGKTTTKEMMAALLSRQGPTCATIGNLNNHIGVPLSLLELKKEHQFAVFEMGASRKGEISCLTRMIQPSLGILTNISQAHLEFFGSLEGVFEAKTEMIREMPSDAPIIFWAEDAWLGRLKNSLGNRGVTFGFKPTCDVQIREVKEHSLEFLVGHAPLSIPLEDIAGFNQLNVAACVAAGWRLGLSLSQIAHGFSHYHSLPMRYEVRELSLGTILVMDAYNANPGSMKAGLSSFCEQYPHRKKIAILGDMKELGPLSSQLHRELGEWIRNLPLKEVHLIGSEMRSCWKALDGFSSFPVHHSLSVEEALEALKHSLAPDSALYFKASRAMEFENLVDTLCSITSPL
ncbi:MAG: UDP-N-acetylmuramoyl-tripeptide--D-alanyl-D-alanine ligase [Elusimicrobia bacterium]|nr:UDP-N-acetylmuramoyl-tripeptide--D-alanyl-D-alanine ligase [Elusimicrobiota bacterium]